MAENTQPTEKTDEQPQHTEETKQAITVSLKGDSETGALRLFVNDQVINEFYPLAAAKVGVALTPNKIDDAVFESLHAAVKSFLGTVSVTK